MSRIRLFTGWAILASVLVASSSVHAEVTRYEASHRAMGSLFTIALYAESDQEARTALAGAFRRIDELDNKLSDYDPESEISHLSASSQTKGSVPVSDDLWRVLIAANKISRASGGAFDVTVGPLTTLWRASRRNLTLPAADEIQQALTCVGHVHLKLCKETQSVTLARPGMRLDLGGIAKGYAVDEALSTLRKLGIRSALVNGGGDIGVADAPPGKAGWKIGIASLARGEKPSILLSLKNQAVATSGDTWQFVEINGRRFSHIVDPDTGLGLTHRSSVTVVAANCTLADSLASATSVLGGSKGLRLIDRFQATEALIIEKVDGKTILRKTAGFDKLPGALGIVPK